MAIPRCCLSDEARGILFILSLDSDEERSDFMMVLNKIEGKFLGESNKTFEPTQHINEQYANAAEGGGTVVPTRRKSYKRPSQTNEGQWSTRK